MTEIKPQTMRRFLFFQFMSIAIAAVGWEVWLDVYYRSEIFEKVLWIIAAIVPLSIAQKQPLITIAIKRTSGLLLIGSGILSCIFLGFPFNIPAIFLLIGISLILASNQTRIQILGSSIFVFALLICIQAILIPVLIWLSASTGATQWLSQILASTLQWIGIDAYVNDVQLILRNGHFVWRFSPSMGTLGIMWITAFTVPGAVLLWRIRGCSTVCIFSVIMLFVFPLVRYVILTLLYLQWETMDWFFSPILSIMLVLPIVVNIATLGSKFALHKNKIVGFSIFSGPRVAFARIICPALVVFSVYLIVLGILLPDPGHQKNGRVLIDEAHGGWEWTTESFGTDWYGHAATYNYWCMLDYISAHYPTKRNYQELSPQVLSNTDILIVKTPSKPFTESEIESIVKWVSDGGGLYLVGDHTNVFGMTTCLQPLSSRFGIKFGYDSTHELEKGGLQRDDISHLLRHPVLSAMPPKLLWGTSCSLTATLNAEPILIGNHIRSRYLDYGRKSFFAESYLLPNERYGVILQCAGVKHGKGRIVAFTDSTIFSNFWAFFPGKSELFLGTMKWLNHFNSVCLTSWLSVISGLLCFMLAKIFIKFKRLPWGCYLLGLLIAIPSAIQTRDFYTASWYALPSSQIPLQTLIFDQKHSNADMPDFAMQGRSDNSYQTFFTWVQRLGIIPQCAYSFDKATEKKQGRIVIIRPQSKLSKHDLYCLDHFLRDGGKLLVIDGSKNPKSMVNLLLQKFGLSIDFHVRMGGVLHTTNVSKPPEMSIPSACQVEGGTPLLKAGDVTVLARTGVHNGEIWACSLADEWSDLALGVSNANVNNRQRLLSELQYWTIRLFMADENPSQN